MAERLEDWIRAHRVCWEISAVRDARGDAGDAPLELTLLARCSSGRGVDPARSECHDVYARLVDLARRAVPPGVGHDLEPYDAAVHLRPESAFAAEVELIVDLFPSSGRGPKVRTELAAALLALGVQSHAWIDGQSRGGDAGDGPRGPGPAARAA